VKQLTPRTLVTTALEDTWPAPETPVLFLGEWCRLHGRRAQWQQRDAVVAPYHWDNRAKLYSDYQYLRGLHEQLLASLAAQLNELHSVDHSLRYWRILIGPWLGWFTQVLFDRWESIHLALASFEISETLCLAQPDAQMVPNDMATFVKLSMQDDWNHHIYGQILKQFTSVKVVQQAGRSAASLTSATRATPVRLRLKRALLQWYCNAMSIAVNDSDALFLNTYLPNRAEMFFNLRFRQPPILWRTIAPVEVATNAAARQWVAAGESLSPFEVCARALIPAQIPAVYLEGYRQLVQQAAGLPWPKNPKLIWTSNSWWADDTFKAWAGAKLERGSPLVIAQHGGGYGMNLFEFTEEHQIAICDRFLTWGWTEPGQVKLKPTGALNLAGHRRYSAKKQTIALLMIDVSPQQSYHLLSNRVASQWLDYFNDQCNFVSHLNQSVTQALIVRLYPSDHGWDQAPRWRDRFPTIQLDDGRSQFATLIRKSRLLLGTMNGTTYLESIIINKPTVIFWNPQHSELRASAVPYFEDLKRVGIFHESPESAAQHVNTVWDNVNAWWETPELQAVLQRFTTRYCFQPKDLLDRVEAALRETIAEHAAGRQSDSEGRQGG
jgi:putative transferase (TIGR04331 family)